MKKTNYCLLVILCPLLNLFAKPLTSNKIAKIGDTLTDVRFGSIVNYKNQKASLSDFKGKHILIDFFGITCGSCVEALPRLDSLQKEYADSIQIIVMAREPNEKIASFLKKYKLKHNITLPFVTDDSILYNMFPHRMIPHEVWLDGNLRVTAITHGWEITRSNVNKMLSDPSFKYPLKKDFMEFDRNVPLLENGNGGDNSNILYRSTVTGFLDGLGGTAGYSKNQQTNSQRLYFTNYIIARLYMAALAVNFPNSRVVLDVKDSSRFSPVNEFKTVGKCYCYEQISPLSISYEECKKGMVQDLDRFFSLTGKIERRIINCYIIAPKAPSARPALFDTTALKNKGTSISSLVKQLNANNIFRDHPPIFLDETNDSRHPAPLFNKAMQDTAVLKTKLEGYGMKLIKAERSMDVLVITDK